MKINSLLFRAAIYIALLGSANVFVSADNSRAVESFQGIANYTSEVAVPTVVEAVLDQNKNYRYNKFYVLDVSSGKYTPSLFVDYSERVDLPFKVMSASSFAVSEKKIYADEPDNLSDQYSQTSVDFNLIDGKPSQAEIILASDVSVMASGIALSYADNVQLPNTVQIEAEVDGQWQIVLASSKPETNVLEFPEINSSKWKLKLQYGQPLRILDIKLIQNNPLKIGKGLRFLVQPQHDYAIYFDPETDPVLPNTETPRLSGGKILKIAIKEQRNPSFKNSDSDQDGVLDINDNCPTVKNENQVDRDYNQIGDACEDFDRDGIIGSLDNCADLPNSDQYDVDADGLGDACDDSDDRVTERHKWLPWASMGFAAAVLLGMIIVAVRTNGKGNSFNQNKNAK